MTSLKLQLESSMKKFFRVDEVFKDFPNDIKTKIFAAAEGKLVYFPKNKNKKSLDQKQVLLKYAKSRNSYEKIGSELGVSKVRIFQIVNQERNRFSKERIEFWRGRGLSLRGIAKLFKKSHETVRQMFSCSY